MRILIDTTYARRAPHSGTAVYLDRLIDALRREPGVEVITVHNAGRGEPAGGGLGSIRNLLSDRRWTQVELPRRARADGVDVIHHPLPAVTRRARGAKVVITVHDLAFERLPQLFDPPFRRYAHRAHRAAAAAAAVVVCVSETTGGDVRSLWEIPRERIVIARHGPGQQLPALQRTRAEHFLYVGDTEPRKDLGTLLAAYTRYRDQLEQPLGLVLAGPAAAIADTTPGVRGEPDPTAEELARLYAGAAALVHTSLYEGFGMTPLEAMSTGTPVIAAGVPGVTEVCGEAARYCQPGAAVSFATAMLELAASPALALELSDRGRRQAAQFTWAASARAHVAAYSLALEPRS